MNKFIILLFLLSSQMVYSQTDKSWKVFDDSEVAIIKIYMDAADLEYMYKNPGSDKEHLGSVVFQNKFINKTVDSVGIRLRGNTSRDAKKKSFKLSFNSFISGRKFYDLEKINLNGEHNDPSIARSKICWDIFRDAGITATRAAHAEVYINDNYYGLYINVEHTDEKFVEKNFEDDSGNLWKCLYPADLEYLGENASSYQSAYELKTNKSANDYSQLVRLTKILKYAPGPALRDSLESVLNIKEVLQYFAVNILVGAWDAYRFLKNNYYLYYSPEDKIIHWIPFDYDNTLGIDFFSIDWTSADPYSFPNIDNSARPLTTRIMAVPEYKNLFTHFMEFYKAKVINLNLLENRIDSLRAMIHPSVVTDPYHSLDYGFTLNDFDSSFTSGSFSNDPDQTGIKPFIRERGESLTSQLKYVDSQPIAYELSFSPQIPLGNDSVHVSVSAFSHSDLTEAVIEFHPGLLTIVEYYPLKRISTDETKLVEEADEFVGVIPPLGEGGFGKFRVKLTNKLGLTETYPKAKFIEIQAEETSRGDLVINELVAKNSSSYLDQNGEADDWIELYNSTDSEISLNGMYLTDDQNDLTKWKIEGAEFVIVPHGFRIFWADSDGKQGADHANFKLDGDGEFLALVSTDGSTIIDSVTFGFQTSDVSYGRLPDGAPGWRFLTPTPLGSNSVTAVEDDDFNPTEFKISAYPNPFNLSVNISYILPASKDGIISIYNILGERVWSKKISSESSNQGSVIWQGIDINGSVQPSGVYLVNAVSDDFKKSIKIMLMK